jgi:hypothetical protein
MSSAPHQSQRTFSSFYMSGVAQKSPVPRRAIDGELAP